MLNVNQNAVYLEIQTDSKTAGDLRIYILGMNGVPGQPGLHPGSCRPDDPTASRLFPNHKYSMHVALISTN